MNTIIITIITSILFMGCFTPDSIKLVDRLKTTIEEVKHVLVSNDEINPEKYMQFLFNDATKSAQTMNKMRYVLGQESNKGETAFDDIGDFIDVLSIIGTEGNDWRHSSEGMNSRMLAEVSDLTAAYRFNQSHTLPIDLYKSRMQPLISANPLTSRFLSDEGSISRKYIEKIIKNSVFDDTFSESCTIYNKKRPFYRSDQEDDLYGYSDETDSDSSLSQVIKAMCKFKPQKNMQAAVSRMLEEQIPRLADPRIQNDIGKMLSSITTPFVDGIKSFFGGKTKAEENLDLIQEKIEEFSRSMIKQYHESINAISKKVNDELVPLRNEVGIYSKRTEQLSEDVKGYAEETAFYRNEIKDLRSTISGFEDKLTRYKTIHDYSSSSQNRAKDYPLDFYEKPNLSQSNFSLGNYSPYYNRNADFNKYFNQFPQGSPFPQYRNNNNSQSNTEDVYSPY